MNSTRAVEATQRFTAAQPCPICKGHDGLDRGAGVRCAGFIMNNGNAAVCTRIESSKPLQTPVGLGWIHPLNGNGHKAGRGGERGVSLPKTRARVQDPPVSPMKTTLARPLARPPSVAGGLTLADYADAKRLPVDFLKLCELSDYKYLEAPAVCMPYRDTTGKEVAIRFRVSMTGAKFRWKKGAKICLYGLWLLQEAKKDGFIFIVEGESDCHTLWHHDLPAAGLPGAAAWNEERDAAHLDGFSKVYVGIEPDSGGEAILKWLATSSIRDRVHLVFFPKETKDPSAVYLSAPEKFKERMAAAMASAVPWHQYESEQRKAAHKDAWLKCKSLAQEPNILSLFARDLERCGVVNEEANGKLLYLSITSRVLPRPVSVVVKGTSSVGKSFVVEITLKFFPEEAFYALSGMSDRSLAYSTEPLVHRMLVIFEAAALNSDFASYLLRSLLSEGCVRYETVESTKDGLKPKLVVREGPTGLLLTTTAIKVHPENETRLLSLSVKDTREQTAAVMLALAGENERQPVDFSPWHALQVWLATGDCRVVVPFAKKLAYKIQPVAVRLRRDFTTLLNLIKAHALLHQDSRNRDREGQIIATIADYEVVLGLLKNVFSENVELSVSPHIRATVQAVRDLGGDNPLNIKPITLVAVAQRLHLDVSTVSRRVQSALKLGYLLNEETHKGKNFKLFLGEPLPADVEILPPAATLSEGGQTLARPVARPLASPVFIGKKPHPCTLASKIGGIPPSLPPLVRQVRRIRPVNGGQNEA